MPSEELTTPFAVVMTDSSYKIYRTTGCIEPAPYGLFDDEYRLIASNGYEFHLWAVEADHLLGELHEFQWRRKLIPLPELPIVTEWNLHRGVFWNESSTALTDIPRLIRALRVLLESSSEHGLEGETHGFTLSRVDLKALVTFLQRADEQGTDITITAY